MRLFDRLFAWYSPTYRWWHTSMLSSEDDDFRFDHYLSYWRSRASRHSCTTTAVLQQRLPLRFDTNYHDTATPTPSVKGMQSTVHFNWYQLFMLFIFFLYFIFRVAWASWWSNGSLEDDYNHTSNTNRLQVPHFGTSTDMLHLWAHWVRVWWLMLLTTDGS